MKSEANVNLDYLVIRGDILILSLYVDDLFFIGSLGPIEYSKKYLIEEFEMKALGLMHYFLGMSAR